MSVPRIGRYAPGLDPLAFAKPPTNVEPRTVLLAAEDGGRSQGVLYSNGSEKTAVCVIHPRADVSRHYTIPPLVQSGYAVLAHQSRWPGNDAMASHELLLLDIAAAVTELRRRDFEQVVLLGYSGGGSVYAFYQAQAVASAGTRLRETAGGDPLDLNQFELPPADGIVFMSAHLGAGKTLMTEIDPSVLDERDPLSVDPGLDMYDPRNGFKTPPESSRYSAEFLERYRAGAARASRPDRCHRAVLYRGAALLPGRRRRGGLRAAQREAAGVRAQAGGSGARHVRVPHRRESGGGRPEPVPVVADVRLAHGGPP